MVLVSARGEGIDLFSPYRFYRVFSGNLLTQLRCLATGMDESGNPVDSARRVISLDEILTKRLHEPVVLYDAESLKVYNWRTSSFYLNATLTRSEIGDAVIAYDSSLFYTLREKSRCSKYGGYITSHKEWERMKAKKQNLYLNSLELQEADHKGFMMQNGEPISQNASVAKIWTYLLQKENIQEYAANAHAVMMQKQSSLLKNNPTTRSGSSTLPFMNLDLSYNSKRKRLNNTGSGFITYSMVLGPMESGSFIWCCYPFQNRASIKEMLVGVPKN